MRTVYVSIGRNIGGEPMPDDDWANFKADVVDRLAGYGDLVTVAEGMGVYDGVREATAIFALVVDGDLDTDRLRGDLARLARLYRQECIALAITPVEFVAAADDWVEVA